MDLSGKTRSVVDEPESRTLEKKIRTIKTARPGVPALN